MGSAHGRAASRTAGSALSRSASRVQSDSSALEGDRSAVSSPLRARNPTPRRLGAARVWSIQQIGMIFIQPDLPEHKLDSGKSLRVPE